MPLDEPFLIFTRRLNELGIRYMVSGSVAAIFYGEPRMTNDVDIVVFLRSPELPGLVNAFPLEEFYCPPLEVMALEIERRQRGHFILIHHETGFKCDVYPVSDALHRWGLSKARRVELDSDSITLAPPEYVIVRKLQFFREGGSQKHLRDISRMVATLGDELDLETVLNLIQEHRLEREWELASIHQD